MTVSEVLANPNFPDVRNEGKHLYQETLQACSIFGPLSHGKVPQGPKVVTSRCAVLDGSIKANFPRWASNFWTFHIDFTAANATFP